MEWSQSEPGDKLPVLWVDAQDPWGAHRSYRNPRSLTLNLQQVDLFFFDLNVTVSWFFCLRIRKFLTYFFILAEPTVVRLRIFGGDWKF